MAPLNDRPVSTLRFTARRITQAALVLWVTTVLVFFGVHAVGDPIDVLVPPEASEAMRTEAAVRMGLDQPLPTQYARFAANLLRGDFGTSFVYGAPVSELLLSRLSASLELALLATAGATLIGVVFGVAAAFRPRHLSSRLSAAVSLIGLSAPTFCVGLMLIFVFAVQLKWLPAGGRGPTQSFLGAEWSLLTVAGWRHALLPALTMGAFQFALMLRVVRAATRTALQSDAVRYARAQGLPETKVLWFHAGKPILLRIVAVLGIELGSTLAFGAVTETIFGWPGLGKLILDSILYLDRPVVVAYLSLTAACFVLINLGTDLLLGWLDPRHRVDAGVGAS